MKRPLALVLLYAACSLVIERTNLLANALAGRGTVLAALGIVAFVLLRLVVVWVVPGWVAWLLLERVIARRSQREAENRAVPSAPSLRSDRDR